MIKKLLSFLLSTAMAVSFTACSLGDSEVGMVSRIDDPGAMQSSSETAEEEPLKSGLSMNGPTEDERSKIFDYKYVDGEEHNAKIMSSDEHPDSGIAKETGEPFHDAEPETPGESEKDAGSESVITEPVESKPETVPENISVPQKSTEDISKNNNADTPAPAANSKTETVNSGKGNANNFNTYDNAEQQNTDANYILNTSTKKFHYPSCRDVKKIAPHNYLEFYGTRSQVIEGKYSPCGHCNP